GRSDPARPARRTRRARYRARRAPRAAGDARGCLHRSDGRDGRGACVMKGFLAQLAISLRLYFRNRMAMLYGYLFPTVLLIAFYVLYRYERVPLVRHMGELLTVTILGGACFGLATTLVSERERGVWRRYRLTPIPAGTLVASTIAARYVLLLSAG